MSQLDDQKNGYIIVEVASKDEFEASIILFREYQEELGKDLSFQSFEKELENLSKIYHEANGTILLVKDLQEGDFAGCVGIKEIGEGICEMKRLYVQPAYRAKKYGLVLANAILKKAKELNYKEMRLDTLKELKPALNLYRKLGFVEMEAYYHNPFDDVVFMRKVIKE